MDTTPHGTQILNPLAQSIWGPRTLQSQKVRAQASDMRRRHAGAADGVGIVRAIDPGRRDVDAWGEDVDEETVVGEGGAVVVGISRADGADGRLRSRRGSDSWKTIVTGRNGEEEALLNGGGCGLVGHWGEDPAEGQVGDGFADAAFGFGVLDRPIDSSEDLGVGAAAFGGEDLDGDEGGLLGDAVGVGACGAGDVRAVAVAITVVFVGDKVGALDGSSSKVVVFGVDASVDDVREGARTSGVIVDVRRCALVAVRNACKTVWWVVLDGVRVHSRVWLNGLDGGDRAQEADSIGNRINRETFEAAEAILVGRLNTGSPSDLRKDIGKDGILLDLDDPRTSNVIFLASLKKDWSGQHSWQSQEKVEERTHRW